jgi:hypothetical protein
MRPLMKHHGKAIAAWLAGWPRGDVLGAGGSATVEFALVASVLLFLGLGIADFGMMFNNYQALAAATRIGAEYARDSPTCQSGVNASVAPPTVSAACSSGIQSAVTSSIYFSPAPTFPSSGACASGWPGVICQCDDGTAIACGQSCAAQNPSRPAPNRVFVAVCTNQAFTPLALWGGALELQSIAELRIQ